MSEILKNLQEMIDNEEPVYFIIEDIDKTDTWDKHPLEFILLLHHILESILKDFFQNDKGISFNIREYHKKYDSSFNQYNIKQVIKIRNNIAHGGLIYDPIETKKMIRNYILYIQHIAKERDNINLKSFVTPLRIEEKLSNNEEVKDEEIANKENKTTSNSKKGIKYFILFLTSLIIAPLIYFNYFTSKSTQIFSGSPEGTYSNLSLDIVKKNIIPKAIVEFSNGSYANMEALAKSDKTDRVFGFVQRDVLQSLSDSAIYDNTEERKILNKTRVLFPMLLEEIHILVQEDNQEIQSFHDLKNKKIAIGAKKSGTFVTGNQLYKELFDKEIQTQPYQEFSKALYSLKEKNIDAIILVGGQPLKQLNQRIDGVKLIPYLQHRPKNGYSLCSIEKNSYPWLNKEKILTLCVESFLVTNRDIDSEYLDKVIKKFDKEKEHLKNLKENAKEWRNYHPKWKSFSSFECRPTLPFGVKYHPLVEWEQPCLEMKKE